MAATIVMVIGILFLIVGLAGAILMLLRSQRTQAPQPEGGAFDPTAWTKLVEALTKAPLWVSCTVVGIGLIVLSGTL